MVADRFATPVVQRSATIPLALPPKNDRSAFSPATIQWAAFALTFVATCYSAGLAALIARGFPGSNGMVVLIELAVLSAAALLCVASGLTRKDWPPMLLGYGFIVAALLVSMLNGRPMIETLRSAAIIVLFFMVGQRMRYATLDRLFLWVSCLVVIVLAIEVVSLQTYVTIFQPARFYSATRGIAVAQFNNSGLFNTATSFEGRFNFGLFSGPRTSSIFLEQISNGNFACLLALYLSARGTKIPRWCLAIELVTVVAILVTANSRFGSVLVFAIAAGYLIFPLLPRTLLPLASGAIAGAALLIILHNIDKIGDDLSGRLAFVGRQFRDEGIGFYLGTDAVKALGEADSGYSYFVGSTTIFGMAMLWLFVNLTPRMDDAPSRRLGWGLIIYFFGQLLVSSTSLLSIKTAALLWALVGCVRLDGRGVTVDTMRRVPA